MLKRPYDAPCTAYITNRIAVLFSAEGMFYYCKQDAVSHTDVMEYWELEEALSEANLQIEYCVPRGTARELAVRIEKWLYSIWILTEQEPGEEKDIEERFLFITDIMELMYQPAKMVDIIQNSRKYLDDCMNGRKDIDSFLDQYRIVLGVKETDKSFILRLVEFQSRYSADHMKMLFSKSNRVVIKKGKSGHAIRIWEDGTFTLYPYQAGIPFCFEPLKEVACA